MNKKINYELIIGIVDRGHGDYVVEASRSAGATGATIIYGRGTGIHEKESILGISIQPEKELVLILIPKGKKESVMQSILDNTEITQEGKGICFSLPVLDVAGINHIINENKGKKK